MTYSLMDLMALAGPMAWPLLVCSVLTVAMILDRWVAMGRAQIQTRRFLDDVSAAVKRHKVGEALALCERTPGPIAQMVRAGLTHHGRSREEIHHAIEEASRREIPPLERHLASLSTLAQVAPLLGLLGTTLGLIRCFQIIQTKTVALQPIGPMDLAQGIWQALLTTVAGLTIAIPAIVAHNDFVRRLQRLTWEMEIAAMDVLRLLAGEES